MSNPMKMNQRVSQTTKANSSISSSLTTSNIANLDDSNINMNQKSNKTLTGLGLLNLKDKTAAADVSIAFDNLYFHVSPIPRPLFRNSTRVISDTSKQFPIFGAKVNLGRPVESEYDSSVTIRRVLCDGTDDLVKHSNFSPSSADLLNSSVESSPTTSSISHNTTYNRILAMKRQCAVLNSTVVDQDASVSAIDERGKENTIEANEQLKGTMIKNALSYDPLKSSVSELSQESEDHTSKTENRKTIQENGISSVGRRKSKRLHKNSLISSNQNKQKNSPLKAGQRKAKEENSFQKEPPDLNKPVITGRKSTDRKDTQVIVLTDWIIKPIPGSHAVCVEGQKVGMNDFWHSTAISEVKTPHVVVTISGSTYQLKGRINKLCTIDNGFSKDIADAFANGFPKNWRELLQQFYRDIEESITFHTEKKQPTRKMKQFKPKSTKKKTGNKEVPEKQFTVWTPGGLIQKEISTADVTMTRSGRISLPPLATWVGQRYIQVEGTNRILIGYKTKAAEQALHQVTDSFLQLPKSKLAKTYHKSLSHSLQSPTTTHMVNRKDCSNKNKKNNVQDAKVVLPKSHLAEENLTKTLEVMNKTPCESKNQETAYQKNKTISKHVVSVPNVSDNKSSHQKLKLRKYSQMLSDVDKDSTQHVSDASFENILKNCSFNPIPKSKAEERLCRKSNVSVSYSGQKSSPDTSPKRVSLKRRVSLLDSSQEENSTKKVRRQEESSHEKTVKWKQKVLVESSLEKKVKEKQKNLYELSMENNVNLKQKHSSPEKNLKVKQKKRNGTCAEEILRPTKISDSKNRKDVSEKLNKNSSKSDISFKKQSMVKKPKNNKSLHDLSTEEISLSDSYLPRKRKHKKNTSKLHDTALTKKSSSSKMKANSKGQNVPKSSEEENNYPIVKKDLKRRLSNATSLDNQKVDVKTRNKRKPQVVKQTEEESWTLNEKEKFHNALDALDSDLLDYWQQVSQLVGTRSEMECQLFHKEFLESKLPNHRKTDNPKKKTKISGRQKGEPIKGGKGTLKRKQGLREFLDELNDGYEDRLFERSPYLTKKPTSLTAVDFNKNDSDVFGTNHNAFTPVASSSLLRTPGTALRAAMASVRKIPMETNQLIENTPVSTTRRLKADQLIKHLQERKKQSKSFHAADQSPEPNVNLDLSALPIKALFSHTNPNVFVDDDDEEEREPYYWDDE